jgi:branched-chain amino acid transport system permease protein
LDAYLIPAVDGVGYGLLLFVVAAGLTLAFGVGDVLNLAHGTLFAFGAYAAAKVSDGTWLSLALAVLVGTAAAAAGGAVLSALLVPLAGRGHLAQALLTFGVALVVGDLLVGLFGPDELPVKVPAVLDRPVDIVGHSYPGYRLAFIGVAALVAVALYVVVARTRVGSLVRATVDDRDMVATLGINVQLVFAGAFLIGALLAGFGGVLGGTMIALAPGEDTSFLLSSLIVVIIGGMGSLGGAAIGALALGLVDAYADVYLVFGDTDLTNYSILLTFALLVGVLAVRPLGLFGRPA